ncbi:MAG: hypothetical protein DLM69_04525 [Candidatus Chloroheliales bacterium]|nr:MAG: hypothetical protein DLM69_04525 [Chloroflexota bacterium]
MVSINWKVLVGIAVVLLALSQFVPGILAALPLLLFLIICPLMMFLMMRGMMGMPQGGSASAAQPTQTANDMVMGGGIAELKAEQEALNRQIAELEARQTPLPSEKVVDAQVVAYLPRR